MARYVRIAETKEIPQNEMRVFKADGREIVLVNIEGTFYAFENKCPHMGYPLFLGSLDKNVLTCGFHCAKFDLKTGRSLGSITRDPLRTLKVKTQGSLILVELTLNT